jgi:hypothetical protein
LIYGPQKIITPPLLNNDCLTGKRKLCFNASEVSNFVENSGAIIGDLVPDNHEAWELYISLRIVISRDITKQILIYYEML